MTYYLEVASIIQLGEGMDNFTPSDTWDDVHTFVVLAAKVFNSPPV